MSVQEIMESNSVLDNTGNTIGHIDGYFKDLYCENLNVATGDTLVYQASTVLVPNEVAGFSSLFANNLDITEGKVRYNTSSVVVLCTMTNIDRDDWVTILNDDSIPFAFGEWYPMLMGFTLPEGVSVVSYDFRQEPGSGNVQIFMTTTGFGALTFSCKVLMFNRRLGW